MKRIDLGLGDRVAGHYPLMMTVRLRSKIRIAECGHIAPTCKSASITHRRHQCVALMLPVRPEEHAVFFLTDARHQKDDDIKRYSKVCLAFADTGAQNYVSVAGEAEVLADPAKIRELWGFPAKAWWKSPDDPNIRLLKVRPIDAQYWDAPGSTAAYVKMAAAALTGSKPSMGENRKVSM